MKPIDKNIVDIDKATTQRCQVPNKPTKGLPGDTFIMGVAQTPHHDPDMQRMVDNVMKKIREDRKEIDPHKVIKRMRDEIKEDRKRVDMPEIELPPAPVIPDNANIDKIISDYFSAIRSRRRISDDDDLILILDDDGFGRDE